MEHSTPRRDHCDPYRVLGVDTGASRQDIARAYRRAVQGAHPDAQPADPRAAARFRELTDAYDLLTDPARRAAPPGRRRRRPAVSAPARNGAMAWPAPPARAAAWPADLGRPSSHRATRRPGRR